MFKIFGGPTQGFDLVRVLSPMEQYNYIADTIEKVLDMSNGPMYASDIHEALKKMGIDLPYTELLTILEIMARSKRIQVHS